MNRARFDPAIFTDYARDAVLTDSWTGFNEKLGRYHGEVGGKGDVQTKFEEILGVIRGNPDERPKYDLSGVEAIFEAMLAALASR